MHAYIHAYIHTYIHTYPHTYIHTYIRNARNAKVVPMSAVKEVGRERVGEIGRGKRGGEGSAIE